MILLFPMENVPCISKPEMDCRRCHNKGASGNLINFLAVRYGISEDEVVEGIRAGGGLLTEFKNRITEVFPDGGACTRKDCID